MPRTALADAPIRALGPRGTPYDIWDGKFRGFGACPLSSGRKRFFVRTDHRCDHGGVDRPGTVALCYK